MDFGASWARRRRRSQPEWASAAAAQPETENSSHRALPRSLWYQDTSHGFCASLLVCIPIGQGSHACAPLRRAGLGRCWQRGNDTESLGSLAPGLGGPVVVAESRALAGGRAELGALARRCGLGVREPGRGPDECALRQRMAGRPAACARPPAAPARHSPRSGFDAGLWPRCARPGSRAPSAPPAGRGNALAVEAWISCRRMMPLRLAARSLSTRSVNGGRVLGFEIPAVDIDGERGEMPAAAGSRARRRCP